MARGAEDHRLVVGERRVEVGQHHRRRAVGHRRAVGPLQRSRDDRVLVRGGAAELEAEILLEMRERVDRAVGVVLGGDPRQRIGPVAILLEIALGDPSEDRGETPVLAAFLLDVARLDQHFADRRAGELGHLLDADHQHAARLAGVDRVHPLVDRRRSGGAGVFHPGRRLEAQIVVRLEDQRGRKFLAHEAPIAVSDIDLVDVGGRDPRILQRAQRDLGDQRFEVAVFMLAEFRVGPAHDACGHAEIPGFEGARLAGKSGGCYDLLPAANNQAGGEGWRTRHSRRC